MTRQEKVMARFKHSIFAGVSVLVSLAILAPLQAGAHCWSYHDYYDGGPSYHHNGGAYRYDDDDRGAYRNRRGQDEEYNENRDIPRDRVQRYRDSGRPCYIQGGRHHYWD